MFYATIEKEAEVLLTTGVADIAGFQQTVKHALYRVMILSSKGERGGRAVE